MPVSKLTIDRRQRVCNAGSKFPLPDVKFRRMLVHLYFSEEAFFPLLISESHWFSMAKCRAADTSLSQAGKAHWCCSDGSWHW